MPSSHPPAPTSAAGGAGDPRARGRGSATVLNLDARRPPDRARYDRGVVSDLCARHGDRAEQAISRVLVALTDRADALRRSGPEDAAVEGRDLRDLRDLSAAIGLTDLAAAAEALHELQGARDARGGPARAACHARVLRLTEPAHLRAWTMDGPPA